MKKLLLISICVCLSNINLLAVPLIIKENKTKEIQVQNTQPQNITNKEKEEEPKIPFTEFNQAHTYDYGCLSLLAEQKFRLEYKKLEAFFYSINSEIWRTNEVVKKKTPKPTIKNIQEDLLTLCNNAVSQSKSMEFLIYQTAITYEMSETRFFDISSFVQNTTEEDFKPKSTMKTQKK